MKCSVLSTIQKINISDFGHNELQMLNMRFLLNYGLNENQTEKCNYVMPPNGMSHKKENKEVLL